MAKITDSINFNLGHLMQQYNSDFANLVFKIAKNTEGLIYLNFCEGNLFEQTKDVFELNGTRALSEMIPAKYRDKIMNSLEEAFEGKSTEINLHYKKRSFSIVAVPVGNEKQISEVIGFILETTEKQGLGDFLQSALNYDILTGLPNLKLLKEELQEKLDNNEANKVKLAVLCINLDRFRLINDTLGYASGDFFLRDRARKIFKLIPNDGMIARIGSDEFVALIPECNGEESVKKIASKIVKSLRSPYVIEDYEFYITTSIGIATYPNDGADVETLLKNSYAAMSRAKQLGGNSYEFYSPALNSKDIERLSLEIDLRHALEREEFVIHYQPQINTLTGETVGIEALIRWDHPELGLIPPNEFIPLAEETGLIINIGEWVLRKACLQNKAWLDAGYPPMRLAVNLSARQFREHNLIKTVRQVLRETKLPPDLLELEITESAVMEDGEYTIKVLNQLGRMGVSISLDDFGTGYSSLNYLKSFPINTLKIDRSFIHELEKDSKDSAIVKALIVLARSLKLNVIAEGVETKKELAFLKRNKCFLAQGYLFSKPITVEALTNVIA